MKKFIATLLVMITLTSVAMVPMAASAESFDTNPIVDVVPMVPMQPYMPMNSGSGVQNVVNGSVKTVGNLVRFFTVDAIETVQSLVCNGGYDKKYFTWSEDALNDYEAAKKQVSDNLSKAGDEIVEAAKTVKDGACWVGGKVADGARWLWNGFTSLF